MYIYPNNVSVASNSGEEHSAHLCPLVGRTSKHDIAISVLKRELGKRSIIFLRHIVSSFGTYPLTEKTNPFRDYSDPRSYQRL